MYIFFIKERATKLNVSCMHVRVWYGDCGEGMWCSNKRLAEGTVCVFRFFIFFFFYFLFLLSCHRWTIHPVRLTPRKPRPAVGSWGRRRTRHRRLPDQEYHLSEAKPSHTHTFCHHLHNTHMHTISIQCGKRQWKEPPKETLSKRKPNTRCIIFIIVSVTHIISYLHSLFSQIKLFEIYTFRCMSVCTKQNKNTFSLVSTVPHARSVVTNYCCVVVASSESFACECFVLSIQLYP